MPLIYYIFIYKNRFSHKLYSHRMKGQYKNNSRGTTTRNNG